MAARIPYAQTKDGASIAYSTPSEEMTVVLYASVVISKDFENPVRLNEVRWRED